MTITRAIILCAGQGSRLLPLTAERPKCLIEVGGRAILDHQIEALGQAGITHATVIGGYRIDQIEAHVAPARAGMTIDVRFNPFWAAASSIGSVWAARDLMDAPFVLLNGDTVYEPALLADCLVRFRAGLNLVVEHVADPEDDDMRVVVADGHVTEVGKALPTAQAGYRSLGIIGTPDADGGGYRRTLDETLRGDNGAMRFHHAVVDRMARDGAVHAVEVSPMHWQEIDRPEDIASWTYAHPDDRIPAA